MAQLADRGQTAGGDNKPTAPGSHLPAIDGLRAVLALCVVVHHAYLTIWPTIYGKAPDAQTGRWTSWAAFGHQAVAAFIVVSGFCLTLPLINRGYTLKDGPIGFYIARARRILPPYYAAIAFSLLLILVAVGHKTGTHWDGALNVTPISVLAHLLMLHQVFGMADINHVFWSIGVEWWIYILFPAILLLAKRFPMEAVTALMLAISYPISYFLSTRTAYGGATIHFVGIFAMGMLAAVWKDRIKTRAMHNLVLWSLPVFCVAFEFAHGGTIASQAQVVLAGLIAMCLLMLGSSSFPSPIKRGLSWLPLVRIGTFSYTVYLIHAPLVQLTWQVFCSPSRSDLANYLVLLGTSIPVVLAVSYVFFLGFERPFMSRRLRKGVDREWVQA